MELYFTRHGKTEWNQERRFQGMLGDSPLLPESYQEIQRLGQHIQEVPFEKIYSSTAPRALNTAKGIAALLRTPVEIIATDGLRELGLGDLEGQSIDEVTAKFPVEMDHLRNHLELYDPTVFDGETIQACLARMETVVAGAVAQHQGPLLFVGHGASMTAAVQWLAGKDLSQLRSMGGLVNNSLTVLETTPPLHLTPYEMKIWNDASFLSGPGEDALG